MAVGRQAQRIHLLEGLALYGKSTDDRRWPGMSRTSVFLVAYYGRKVAELVGLTDCSRDVVTKYQQRLGMIRVSAGGWCRQYNSAKSSRAVDRHVEQIFGNVRFAAVPFPDLTMPSGIPQKRRHFAGGDHVPVDERVPIAIAAFSSTSRTVASSLPAPSANAAINFGRGTPSVVGRTPATFSSRRLQMANSNLVSKRPQRIANVPMR